MANLALLDLISPYVLRGENIGAQHAALSVLRVVSCEEACDDFGVVVRGRCEFNGHMNIDPGGLRVDAGADEGAAAFDPNRRSPVFDIRETAVAFELFVPRAGSAIIAAGAATITDPGFTATRDVFDAWDALPLDPAPSDYPASGFTLDLILDAPSVRPPFLHPAKLDAQGMLIPDKSVKEVALTLPKLRFRLAHGNASGSQLTFDLVSAGVSSLDDPGNIDVAELVSMTPPYAFIGSVKDRVFGIGFRGATLDLSNGTTPPALMQKCGVGDDWTGLYLPEVRVFIAPEGARDFAFEAGANQLLIGFGDGDGIWGDFEAALINQGSGELKLSARFFDSEGHAYGIEQVDATHAKARVPAQTRMVVDVSGGRTPYTRKVRVGGGPAQTGMTFNLDLSTASPQDIVVTVDDASGTALHATLTIHAERRQATPVLATPGETPAPVLIATLTAAADTPKIVIASQTTQDVLLTTDPADPTILWSLDGGAETGPQTSFLVTLAPGDTHTARARKPGASVPGSLDFYYYYNEPPDSLGDDAQRLESFGEAGQNVSNVRAVSKDTPLRDGVSRPPWIAYKPQFDLAPAGSVIRIIGQASYEGHAEASYRRFNYLLARRRAITARELIRAHFAAKNFDLTGMLPAEGTQDDAAVNAWVSSTGWMTHAAPDDRDWWKASVQLPAGLSTADDDAEGTLNRPTAPSVPAEIPVRDPPVPQPQAPDWFRSARLKVRIVRSTLIAAEIDAEIDFQTATEQKLAASGQLGGAQPPQGHTLQNGVPLGPDNPADGITKFQILCQSDPATGNVTTLMAVGADPADKDGLACWGWMPGEAVPSDKNVALSLLGSYLSFWPLLVAAAAGGKGELVDAILPGAALEVPGAIALLPWFEVERVIVYGAEYLQRNHGDEFEGNLLFDVGIDWSANLLDIIKIEKEHPLSVRYKAIGLRFGNRTDDGTAQFSLRPIFDSSRGYTIDLQSGGALKIAKPLGQILRVLGARLSRTNPLTFEIDIGLGVDLGVVSVDRASVRAYLDGSHPPELTALAASVDIPGALVGSGYLQIGSATDSGGHTISTIGGQLDLTLRPLSLRVAASVEVANIPADAGGPATGVYVGLNVVLPVGLPLGSSGLGIFGFRGIFGMHYERNASIGAGSGVPALAWLQAAGGKPNLLVNPDTQVKLWVPHVDRWAFGLGMLVGTMEGGVIMNLDGTLLLELPGPRVLIMMNARIVSPPPSMDQLGNSGGVLAVIEITPEHFLLGILVHWDIQHLIKIEIPIEALFPFAPDSGKWHIYLGARPDLGRPVEVDVLGIVKGTGYLMFKGDGLPPYHVHNATLPAIQGFGIGLGVAASFTWGDTSVGLYLRIGGGMDAVLGLDPFVLAGTIYVSGELRLFIVSIGADAQLTVIVNEQPDGDLALYIHGKACGHVSLLFFDIEGCVDVTISGPSPSAPMPLLVDKVSLKSHSPALLVGTGVDRGIDASLGDCLAQDAKPDVNDPHLPVVPIDVVPVVSMKIPPVAAASLTLGGVGTSVPSAPGVPVDGYAERGGERYRYELSALVLERIDPSSGASIAPPVQGSTAPVVWWTVQDATGSNATAQLALFTWDPAPATKALEKTDRLKETIHERWGRVCEDAAPAADVLWTFRWEAVGPSPTGWDLEGIAWPDPPGTRRSTPPETRLHVSERWRSGDIALDTLRGIFPAMVIAGLVPCYQPPAKGGPGIIRRPPMDVIKLPATLPRLVVGGVGPVHAAVPSGAAAAPHDPVHAALVRRDSQAPLRITSALHAKVRTGLADAVATGLSAGAATVMSPPQALSEVVRKLQQSEPLANAELLATFGAMATIQPSAASIPMMLVPGKRCQVRALEAPLLDDGRPIVFGDPAKAKTVAEQLKAHGVIHGPLNDVVVLHTGAFAQLDLLLFVRRHLLSPRQLVVRTLDGNGQQLASLFISTADIAPPKTLPAHWTDPTGPWVDDIAELLEAPAQLDGYVAVYVRVPKAPKADRVEIGIVPDPRTDAKHARDGVAAGQKQLFPGYYVGAIGAVSFAEVARSDWDQTQIDRDRETITKALGSSDNVLLFADSLYRLTATWSGTRKSDGQTRGSETQTFWFKTDRIGVTGDSPPKPVFLSTPPLPVRLDPWMLVTLPADRETGCFAGEPTRLVFNTHDVDRVFAAYGKELRVRFQAASSRHPAGGGAVPHPFPINAATVVPLKATVLSPWEDAAQEVLAGSCIPSDGDRVRHSQVDIPIPLELFTDYIMDVEMVDVGAAPDARGPGIYRRHFSTGGFTTLNDFAASLQGAWPTARACEPGALDAVRAYFNGRAPLGAELDDQLRSHGIEPLEVPHHARILVFWSQAGGNPPQPAGVLVDATEPVWRSRPYPSSVTDDTGPVTAQRWVLADTEWLELQDQSVAGVVAAGGLIRAPGGQRALIVLAPNARGKTLKIDLVSKAFPALTFLTQTEQRATLIELKLDRAPWEES